MEERTRKIRKKLCVIQILNWTLFDIFSGALPYLYIAIVSEGSSIGKAAYIAMIPALVLLSWRITEVVEIYTTLIKKSAFVTNLREFLSYTPKKDERELITAEKLGDIEIKNMSFTYEGADKPTLHNVSLTVHKGEKIAIVGHNGAGKTTLVKLIMGLYEPTEGEIDISGRKTTEYEPKSFHNRFGTVFQDLQVFALPLSHNVLMHKPKK